MHLQDVKHTQGSFVEEEITQCNESDCGLSDSDLISFLSEVPEPIQAAMTTFIELHPNWDQYRLIQAALAGFLVQNGVESRLVTRLYLDNMFSSQSFGQDLSIKSP